MRDTDKVELHFSHTEKEYMAAVRFYLLHSPELMARISVIFVLISICLLMLDVVLDFLLPLWALFALIFLLGVATFHAYLIDLPRRYFRSDPKFREQYELIFTDAGIEFKTNNIKSTIAWSLYSRVIENESFYILVYGKNLPSLSILPKRAFRNSEQETAFRTMLRRHIDPNFELSDGEREHDYVPSSLQPPDWR